MSVQIIVDDKTEMTEDQLKEIQDIRFRTYLEARRRLAQSKG